MESEKTYQTVGIVPKSNWHITEWGKIDTPYTYMHDRSLSYLGTAISIKSHDVAMKVYYKLSHMTCEQRYSNKNRSNLEHFTQIFWFISNFNFNGNGSECLIGLYLRNI